ncbi:penicillin-binding transpeptidase domain-containing protein [Kitasatospora sp. NPDC018619]|uniref:penicillin-binding transpeptidase domain-containing protein n=1 Tax=unclassified Kitasatospora TaxID=2633591 RepID=UPI00379FB2C8
MSRRTRPGTAPRSASSPWRRTPWSGGGPGTRTRCCCRFARVRGLMIDVVENGPGGDARIPGAVVGGKTGTAQLGAGTGGTPYAWFIGWAVPVGSQAVPPVAVAVVVADSDAADVTGSGPAAPIARSVMRAVLGG